MCARASARSLPISIGGGIMFIAIGYLSPAAVPLKLRMIVGALIGAAGTLLLVWADGQSWYWKLVAPGMFVGSFGMAIVFISANNSLLMRVPPEYAGVVGGIFNATLQFGAVTGLAINGTIKSGFKGTDAEGKEIIRWKGYSSTFIFMTVLCAVCAIISAIWFKNPLQQPPLSQEEEEENHQSERTGMGNTSQTSTTETARV